MILVYMDACCLNRPFDDQTQPRVHLEAEAILIVLERIQNGEWEWLGSTALDFEIRQTADAERRSRMELIAETATRRILVGAQQEERARELQNLGFAALDALHLACAESGNADFFLTTDDRLLRAAARLQKQLHIPVRNPLVLIEEVSQT